MSNSFIGQYLLDQEILTQSQLDHALQVQQSSNIRLGQLSINEGLLGIKQVLYINRQQRLLNKKFGDIAIEKNLLSGQQVEDLLALQSSRRKRLGEILIEEGLLDEQTLNEVLQAQQKQQKNLSNSIDEITKSNALENTVNQILGSYEKIFLRCLDSHFKSSELLTDHQSLKHYNRIVTININHEDCYIDISLAISDSSMVDLCSRFMGIPKTECDMGLAKDAVGELLNCVAGYVITDVISAECSPSPSAPSFKDSISQVIGDHTEPVIVEFASDIGTGVIIITQTNLQ